ncbi:hypothetical protein NBRC3257_1840 [Gluconobacter thailandicus NBRC 3257]|uniref:Transposase n=1 Tax=Gluconobacter thailandicus NBRC 3257 TaxID=1381097 RepID=A0ABQ0IXB2_GLUTH|nr:hypothetical protein NBRC3255_3071 [Gluconobacter thailandicus NBRC 3255]GAD26841.1 hypothetical protein NBRC3257_1840 [Gluconobacter thailandicus NBRC 3257]
MQTRTFANTTPSQNEICPMRQVWCGLSCSNLPAMSDYED